MMAQFPKFMGRSMISTFFSCFWTNYATAICRIGVAPRGLLPVQYRFPRDQQQVKRCNRASYILAKPVPPGPGASRKSESAFESGDPRLDSGPKVPELPVHPLALDHLLHAEPSSFRESDILDARFFGFFKIFSRGEPCIGGRLAGSPPVNRLLTIHEGKEKTRISRVPAPNHAIKDQPRLPRGKKQFVTVDGLSVSLFDDVRVAFEDGEHLLLRRDLLFIDHAASGLIHHFVEELKRALQLVGQNTGANSLNPVLIFISPQNFNGFGRIASYLDGYAEKVLVTFDSHFFLLRVADFLYSLGDRPLMVAKSVRRSRIELHAKRKQPGDEQDAVLDKSRILRIMNIGLCGRRIHTNDASLFHSRLGGIADQGLYDLLPSQLADRFDVVLKGGSARALPPSEPCKRSEGAGVFQMKGELLVAEAPVLLQNGGSQGLFGRHAATADLSVPQPDQILMNQIQDARICIEDGGHRLELPPDLATGQRMAQVQLGVLLFTHFLLSIIVIVRNFKLLHFNMPEKRSKCNRNRIDFDFKIK